MALAFKGRKNANAPRLGTGLRRLGASDDAVIRDDVQSLNVAFGDHRTLDELRTLVTNTALSANERNRRSAACCSARRRISVSRWCGCLADRAVAVEAIRGLAHYKEARHPVEDPGSLAVVGPLERSEMIQTLASRPASAASC